MPSHKGQNFVDLSSSMSILSEKGDLGQDHFKWNSIKKFIYLMVTFSSCSSTFDMFSKIKHNLRIVDFILMEITVGMPYLFMDFFIKQYTRKLDFNMSLNPLLKGITYGTLIQTGMYILLYASDLADTFWFFTASFSSPPSWTVCPQKEKCLNYLELAVKCGKETIPINITSAHFNYVKSFSAKDQNAITTRVFACAVVWICNFLFSSVTDETLLKITKISFIWRVASTSFIFFLLLLFPRNFYPTKIFGEIMSLDAPTSFIASVELVSHAYGIGFIGVYDFQLMSPFTMVDNAVVIFTILFTAMGLVRSFIVRVLYTVLSNCVSIEITVSYHYLSFAIMPLGSEFLKVHRIYIIFIYGNLIISTIAYLAMMTLSMTKLLHREFHSLKNVYIVGILCVIGFSVSVSICAEQDPYCTAQAILSQSSHKIWSTHTRWPGLATGWGGRLDVFYAVFSWYIRHPREDLVRSYFTQPEQTHWMHDNIKTSMLKNEGINGIVYGLKLTSLYLGGCKVAIIMWVYGVGKFSTDIQFWLGFKPTTYWILCWSVLPIVLFGFVADRLYHLTKIRNENKMIAAIGWIVFCVLIVILFQVRTISKYMISNHFINAFRSSKNYGPPENEDREKRRNYSETLRLRKCKHSCKVLDETFDCNHMPLMFRSPTLSEEESEESEELMRIYEASMSGKDARMSTTVDMTQFHS